MATTVNAPSVYPPGSNVSITGVVVSGQTVVGGVEGHLLGTPTFKLTKALVGVASAQAFGAITFKGGQTTFPLGVGSAQAFGTIKLKSGVPVGGVSSAQAFGTPKLNQYVQVQGVWPNWWFPYLPSITGGVISGDGHVVGGIGGPGGGIGHVTILTSVKVAVGGVASAAQLGSVRIVQIVHPLAVPSAAAFGTQLGWKLGVWGVPSAGQIGRPLVYKVLIWASACQPLTLTASACQPLTLSASACVEDEELLVASPVDRS